MYHILYSYNKLEERKLLRKSENTFTVVYCKKSAYKCTCTVQMHLFKGQLYMCIPCVEVLSTGLLS